MAHLASPKLTAKLGVVLPRDTLVEQTDEYIKVVRSFALEPSTPWHEHLLATERHAVALRDLLNHWTPTAQVPVKIVEEARALLHAFGVPSPPDGWDAFQGWEGASLVVHSAPPEKRPDPEEMLEMRTYTRARMENALTSYFGSGFAADDAWVLVRDFNLTISGHMWTPDFAAYHRTKIPSEGEESVPDWVCEIPLPSDEEECRRRIGDYIRAGVRHLWLCDPVRRNVEVYTRLPEEPGRASLRSIEEGDPQGSDFLPPRERVPFNVASLWAQRPPKN